MGKASLLIRDVQPEQHDRDGNADCDREADRRTELGACEPDPDAGQDHVHRRNCAGAGEESLEGSRAKSERRHGGFEMPIVVSRVEEGERVRPEPSVVLSDPSHMVQQPDAFHCVPDHGDERELTEHEQGREHGCDERREIAGPPDEAEGDQRARDRSHVQHRSPHLLGDDGAPGGLRREMLRRQGTHERRLRNVLRHSAPLEHFDVGRREHALDPLRARAHDARSGAPVRSDTCPRRWQAPSSMRPGRSTMAMRSLQTDYLVVGAGAMGMAFTDALVDHADVHVTLVDRRHTAGGHWQDAYPFVQLHQASVFYGVASTVLGHGAVQRSGPEVGLQERARQSEIQAYYDDLLHRRFVGSDRVTFLGASEHHTDGSSQLVTSRVSGETREIEVRRRVVDATYLSPTIPATTPPPFGVADDVDVVPINELARLEAAAKTYVIVGSGKTATDGIVWLLANGVPQERIVWVRPREPWMLNRAVVQPDPAVALGLAADTLAAAADAESLDDLFLRLEDAGVMLRIDRDVLPTMAKTPTVGE